MVYLGSELVNQARYIAGRVTAPDAELYAIRAAILCAIGHEECQQITIFMDHIAAAKRAVDPSVHLGQGHSLAVCAALSMWFEGNPLRTIEFIHAPSQLGWHIHGLTHGFVRAMPVVFSGVSPETSLDSIHSKAAKSCADAWISKYQHASYRG